MFSRLAWPRSVVDIDDIPSRFEQSAFAETSIKDRLLSLSRIFAWRRREALLGKRFSVLAVCSEQDKRYIEGLTAGAPTFVIPNGFEPPCRTPARSAFVPVRFGFVGLFDHAPNSEGIQWFCERSWPLIKQAIPDARLRVAGRQNGGLNLSGRDIDLLGWVEDIDREIATWSAMVVPIRTGAGTRVKIPLAYSRRCPIVSTPLGAFGFADQSGETLLMADTAEQFAAACIQMIERPVETEAMVERAWRQFNEKWTWEAIQPRVAAAVECCFYNK